MAFVMSQTPSRGPRGPIIVDDDVVLPQVKVRLVGGLPVVADCVCSV